MAGILDPKTRIIDTVITRQGRRQISSGKMRVKYVSFTDSATFYEADVSGSSDASSRIFLEACSYTQDQITYESDDGGLAVPFRAGSLELIGNKILSSSSDFLSHVTGSAFSSQANTMLSSSLQNFRNLQMIGTDDYFIDNDDFKLSTNKVFFTVSDKEPFKKTDLSTVKIENAENFFQDRRLSHSKNFLYLPPVNKKIRGKSQSLGKYPKLSQEPILKNSDLNKILRDKQKRTILFDKTTHENNLVVQVFENSSSSFKKLDIIDFGEFHDSASSRSRRIFFVGKIFTDSLGQCSFVNMFIMMFD